MSQEDPSLPIPLVEWDWDNPHRRTDHHMVVYGPNKTHEYKYVSGPITVKTTDKSTVTSCKRHYYYIEIATGDVTYDQTVKWRSISKLYLMVGGPLDKQKVSEDQLREKGLIDEYIWYRTWKKLPDYPRICFLHTSLLK